MLEIPVADRPRCYVVTQGCFKIEDLETEILPGAATLNGWTRVACCELAGFQFTTVDIDDPDDADTAEALALELVCDLPQDEVALRADLRFVSELRETGILTDDVVVPAQVSTDMVVQVRPLRNDAEGVGTVRTLVAAMPPCGPNEIIVAVEKTLLPTNLLKNQTSDQISRACVEVVGRVSEVGSNIVDLQPGQRVAGLCPSEIASHIGGDREAFFLVPIEAGIETGQLVAEIGRRAVAKRAVQQHELDPHDQAIVEWTPMGQVVAAELKRMGLEVTLVTGDPESIPADIREEYRLCLMCPEAVQLSADRLGGFDLLAVRLEPWRESMGFGALRSGGGIIGLDESAGTIEGLPETLGTLSRTTLSNWIHDRRRLETAIGRAVVDLTDGVQSISPFEVSVADLAWKRLPLSETETDLVLCYDTHDQDLPLVQPDELSFKPNATYVITGGFGGFGRKTALWLARWGAGNIVLTGRRGADSEDKQAFVGELSRLGVNAVAVACDTGDAQQVGELINEIAQTLPPLKGVFHSGAVIIDQAIAETDLATFNQVMQAKATGAWNLHQATAGIELDHFVMYSSLSNQIGNSRQGAYCAANGFLNGLARWRQSQGLPGISINWGAISDVGVITRDDKLEQFLKHVGLRGLPSAEGLELLRIGLARNVEQFGVVVIKSWADWARYETLGAQSPRFTAVVSADSEGDNDGLKQQLVAELAALNPAAQIDLMAQLSSQIVASVLKSDPENIPIDRPINDLGIDSLMATEIQVLFESKLGIAISVLELLGDMTLRNLSANIIESLQDELQSVQSSDRIQHQPISEVSA